MLSPEDRGSYSCPHKFYLIECLRYALELSAWELESNLSAKLLKEYYDVVARLEDMLTDYGVKCDCEAPIVHKCLR